MIIYLIKCIKSILHASANMRERIYIQGVADHPYQQNISKTERGRQKISDKSCKVSSNALHGNISMTLKSVVKVT